MVLVLVSLVLKMLVVTVVTNKDAADGAVCDEGDGGMKDAVNFCLKASVSTTTSPSAAFASSSNQEHHGRAAPAPIRIRQHRRRKTNRRSIGREVVVVVDTWPNVSVYVEDGA